MRRYFPENSDKFGHSSPMNKYSKNREKEVFGWDGCMRLESSGNGERARKKSKIRQLSYLIVRIRRHLAVLELDDEKSALQCELLPVALAIERLSIKQRPSILGRTPQSAN